LRALSGVALYAAAVLPPLAAQAVRLALVIGVPYSYGAGSRSEQTPLASSRARHPC